MTTRVDLAVVGGGISGLAAAWEAHRQGARVVVLEASDRAGGKLRTSPLAGIPLDESADAFLARVPEGIELCRQLGIADELVAPSTGRAYVWTGGSLRLLPGEQLLGVPTDLDAVAATGILSPEGLARARQDLARSADPGAPNADTANYRRIHTNRSDRAGGDSGRDDAGVHTSRLSGIAEDNDAHDHGPTGTAENRSPANGTAGDEAVGELIRRRLGDEVLDRLVAPLIGGIWAGNCDRLSLAVAAPLLAEASRRDPSLIRGAAAIRASRASRGKTAARTPGPADVVGPAGPHDLGGTNASDHNSNGWPGDPRGASEPAIGRGEATAMGPGPAGTNDPGAAGGPEGELTPGGPSSAADPVFLTPRGGMGRLVEVLAEALGDRVRTGAAVTGIEREPDGRWRLEPGGVVADAVVIATPAFAAAPLVTPHCAAAAGTLGAIEHASIAMLALAVPRDGIDRPLDGSGFLVPPSEGRLLTACSWTSSKWGHLAGDGSVALLRASAGRDGDQRALALDDDALVQTLLQDLRDTMGLKSEPIATRITRWPRSFPQPRPGHLARVAAVEAALSNDAPGLAVAGAWMRGVGIPACIRSGRQAAAQLLGMRSSAPR